MPIKNASAIPTIYFDKNFLNEKELLYIKENITSDKLPLAYNQCQTKNDFIPFFGHLLIDRNDGKSKSKHTKFFKKLAIKIAKKNGLKISKFLRGSINFVFPFKKEAVYHKDHIIDHYNLLIYLNDSDGFTEIKNKDQLIQVKPELGKYVLFKNLLHRANAPTDDSVRIVCVMTFN
jgi:hypothetical protein